MKLKPYQYWAIIATLFFHVILVWGLFFVEMNRQRENVVYELDLQNDLKQEKQDIQEVKIEDEAKVLVQELLSNRASKRLEVSEVEPFNASDETQKLVANFEAQKKQVSKIQRKMNKPTLVQEKRVQKENPKQEAEPQTVFYVGKSRVEYFLAERYRVKLPIPVYQCEGGGTVEIAIVVNRQGIVLNAEIIKERSRSSSECMQEAARNAALMSVFSERPEATELQKGRIVYKFVPQ